MNTRTSDSLINSSTPLSVVAEPTNRIQTKTPRFQLAHRGSVAQKLDKYQEVTAATELDMKPLHTFISLAVGTCLICFKLHKAFKCLLVLRSSIYRTSRHDDGLGKEFRFTATGREKLPQGCV